ncbi:MAG: flagellar biosynthesis protein FlhA [Gammaproteobacteria bacterium]|nr:flagellar biosynthesis protein FlhA [Gammaproteobacteria bacterium]
MNQTVVMNGLKDLKRLNAGAPLIVLAVLAMMVLPLPTPLLDVLFTFNIALSLIVLLAVIYGRRPLDFAAFPTVLLIATLLRLSLNIASTRVVLLHGHSGPGAAGQVIQAFGDFVVGGNYTVGFVVFMILVVINFVVITKGGGRISEVSARFTLDAMPGKQMAIDADLNAGLIDRDEARLRRVEVAQEADFYGAMDGASKFVRGDAIAGLLVMAINILGGLAVGVLQHGMAVSEAARVFTLLTIGDGLVAQIPSLLLATAAAVIVTRVSSASDMGEQIIAQLFANPRTLAVTAGVLGLMGVIPGMPNAAFLTFAGVSGAGAWMLAEHARQRRRVTEQAPPPALPAESRELSWEDVAPVDAIGLEVGYRLIPMVDKSQGGQLLARLKGVRKKLSQELGFLVPAVHIRDNLDLAPNAYSISLLGVTISKSEVYPERELAINPGQVYGDLKGTVVTDPVFGLQAVWIDASQRDHAQACGYTVVDASTVIATHLSQLLQEHAHELLGHDEVQHLLERLKQSHPRLVEDLVPKQLALGGVVTVLQNLLRERVPVRDIRTILEVLSAQAARGQEPGALTAAVRVALGRMIVQQINGLESELPVITLDHALEQLLHKSAQALAGGDIAMEPGLANRLVAALRAAHQQQELAGQPSVLLVSDALRDYMARFVRHATKGMYVLAFGELPEHADIRIVATVGGPESGR